MIKKILRNIYILAFKPIGVTREINGKNYQISAYVARGIPKKIKIPMLQSLLKSAQGKSVFFDVGAHIGTWSVLVANELNKKGKVYAFEPTPHSFKILENQALVQKRKNIYPINSAVGDFTGSIELLDHGIDFENLAKNKVIIDSNKNNISGSKYNSVKIMDLDSFCGSKNIIPELVKVDVEGAELMVLKGMKNVLKDYDVKVYIELHQFAWEEFNTSPEKFLKYINDLGYNCYDPEDNLINESAKIASNNDLGYVYIKK